MALPEGDSLLLLHNPRCSKSRAAKALLEERGVNFWLRLYLEEPLSRAELEELRRRLGRPAREWVRSSEPTFGAAGLSALAYDPMAGVNRMTRNQAAANAELTINGLAISSTTNTLTEVMDGLTLTLGKVTTAPVAVTVSTDTATIKKNLTDFASAYNDVVKYLRDQTKYNDANKSAGELQGDRSAVMMLGQLRSLAGASTGASSIFARLSSLGFDPQSDGSLKTNATKLDAAMGNLTELRRAFANVDDAVPANRGLGVQMRQFVDGLLADDGALDSRQEALRASITRNDKRQDQLELRVAAFEKRVRAQYTALDATMGQMSGLSSYLSQQIAQFNKS